MNYFLFSNPSDLSQLHATPGQQSQLLLNVHPNQIACSILMHWEKKKNPQLVSINSAKANTL